MFNSNKNNVFKKYQKKAVIERTVSINDLKLKEFDGIPLGEPEIRALKNFDTYRIQNLNQKKDERDFSSRYRHLQAMAHLFPYEEFLKPDYNR
jgi:hypothetical protein